MDALLVSVEEAARALGVGRDLVYELMASGRLPRVKLGRRTLIPAKALAEWVEREAMAASLATAESEPAETPTIAVLVGGDGNRSSGPAALRKVSERTLRAAADKSDAEKESRRGVS